MLRNCWRCAASLTILTLAPWLWSAPPSVTAITPRGAPPGQAIEVVVDGKDLTPKTRLSFPFKATAELIADAKPNPAQVRFQVTVDPSVPAGIYPLLVVSEDGVSALQWFVVDPLPQVKEAENNQPHSAAQKVPFGVTITGQCSGGDVDFFRFPMKQGQRVVLETESARLGSGVLPQLRLTDGNGRFLAAADDQKLRGDSRLIYTAPADGDYVVEFADSRYKGTAPAHYRLKIADCDVIDEVFPLGGRRGDTVEFTLFPNPGPPIKLSRKLEDGVLPGSMLLTLDKGSKPGGLSTEVLVGWLPEMVLASPTKDAVEVQPPIVVNGRLEQKGQAQQVRFAVQPGQKYRLAIEAESRGSYLDAVLRVADQAGKQQTLVDDLTVNLIPGQPPSVFADPATEVTVPAGVTHLVAEVRDQRNRGGINFGYRLTIEPAPNDFEVRQPLTELNVPVTGSAELVVPIVRRGYAGPIQLSIANLPPGLAVHGGQVPVDGTAGTLTITSQADLSDPVRLRIEGIATIDGKEVRRAAQQALIISKEGSPGAALRTMTHFVVGTTSAEPFAVQGPPAVEAVKGYPVNVTVTVTRNPQAKVGDVSVSGAVPPYLSLDGKTPANALFTVQPGNATAESAMFILTPKTNAPDGTMALLVQGRTKINNKDAAVIGPAVTLTVKPPFIVVPPAALELPVGQMVTLQGKLERQPVFQEAVQWKVEGLPKGVTLVKPPPPIAAASSEFAVELKIDPKLTPAKANLTLSFSTTIGGAAYNHPPVTVPIEIK